MCDVLMLGHFRKSSRSIEGALEHMGCSVRRVLEVSEAVEHLSTSPCDLIVAEISAPSVDLDVLEKLTAGPAQPEMIVVSEKGDSHVAENVLRLGVWSYVVLNGDQAPLLTALEEVLAFLRENARSRQGAPRKSCGIVGDSPALQRCLNLVAQAASASGNVLITGETGTGKELFARAIHANGLRPKSPFIVVDCTVLPHNLVESLLFGHKKGAFTGADRDREGLVAYAHGGILFLDEVGELPLDVQQKFLRLLESGTYRMLGEVEEKTSRFRVIAATNRDLDHMAELGTFRKDLLFRLSSFRIALPPLRERKSDIALLADYHYRRLCRLYEIDPLPLNASFLSFLCEYDWPGNIRELVSAIDVALNAAGRGRSLYPKHLPHHIRVAVAKKSIQSLPEGFVGSGSPQATASCGRFATASGLTFKEFKENSEKQYLAELIVLCRHDITKVSKMSGLSRSRVYELLKKHRLLSDRVGSCPSP